MLITCTHCQKQLNLPDEKVPPRAFALNCPSCKGRIEVDPAQATEASDQSAPAVDIGGDFEALPPLRPSDRILLRELYPVAAIANLTSESPEGLEAALRVIGMQEVQTVTSLEAATELMTETEVTILLIWMEKASAPPFPLLEPLHKLPLDIRRRTFVALVAENVRTLDGQVAFYLQVNCLINSKDLRPVPRELQRALVHHLRLYRHWDSHQE